MSEVGMIGQKSPWQRPPSLLGALEESLQMLTVLGPALPSLKPAVTWSSYSISDPILHLLSGSFGACGHLHRPGHCPCPRAAGEHLRSVCWVGPLCLVTAPSRVGDLGADFKVLYTQEKYTTCAVERLVDSGHVCVTSTQNKSTGITVTSQDSGNLGALGIPVSCSGFVLGAGVLENGTIGS